MGNTKGAVVTLGGGSDSLYAVKTSIVDSELDLGDDADLVSMTNVQIDGTTLNLGASDVGPSIARIRAVGAAKADEDAPPAVGDLVGVSGDVRNSRIEQGAGNSTSAFRGLFFDNTFDYGSGVDRLDISGGVRGGRILLGKGDDVFTLAGAVQNLPVDLGDGDDQMKLDAETEGLTVNLGDGMDRVLIGQNFRGSVLFTDPTRSKTDRRGNNLRNEEQIILDGAGWRLGANDNEFVREIDGEIVATVNVADDNVEAVVTSEGDVLRYLEPTRKRHWLFDSFIFKAVDFVAGVCSFFFAPCAAVKGWTTAVKTADNNDTFGFFLNALSLSAGVAETDPTVTTSQLKGIDTVTRIVNGTEGIVNGDISAVVGAVGGNSTRMIYDGTVAVTTGEGDFITGVGNIAAGLGLYTNDPNTIAVTDYFRQSAVAVDKALDGDLAGAAADGFNIALDVTKRDRVREFTASLDPNEPQFLRDIRVHYFVQDDQPDAFLQTASEVAGLLATPKASLDFWKNLAVFVDDQFFDGDVKDGIESYITERILGKTPELPTFDGAVERLEQQREVFEQLQRKNPPGPLPAVNDGRPTKPEQGASPAARATTSAPTLLTVPVPDVPIPTRGDPVNTAGELKNNIGGAAPEPSLTWVTLQDEKGDSYRVDVIVIEGPDGTKHFFADTGSPVERPITLDDLPPGVVPVLDNPPEVDGEYDPLEDSIRRNNLPNDSGSFVPMPIDPGTRAVPAPVGAGMTSSGGFVPTIAPIEELVSA